MAPKKMETKKRIIEEPIKSVTEVKRVTFKVARSGYMSFLSKLRAEVHVPGRMKHGIPVLPEEKEPTKSEDFIEACLETKDNGLVLLIRRDNLYVVGFKERNAEAYFEFKSKEVNEKKKNKKNFPRKEENKTKVIPDTLLSSQLDFSSSYMELASGEVSNLSFNNYTIKDAVNFLANYKPRETDVRKNHGKHASTSKEVGEAARSKKKDVRVRGNEKVNDREAKKHLARLVFAVSEAMRFESAAKFVFDQMGSVQSEKIGCDLNEEIHNWVLLSRRILDNITPPSEEQLNIYRESIKVIKPFPGVERYLFPAPPVDGHPIAEPMEID